MTGKLTKADFLKHRQENSPGGPNLIFVGTQKQYGATVDKVHALIYRVKVVTGCVPSLRLGFKDIVNGVESVLAKTAIDGVEPNQVLFDEFTGYQEWINDSYGLGTMFDFTGTDNPVFNPGSIKVNNLMEEPHLVDARAFTSDHKVGLGASVGGVGFVERMEGGERVLVSDTKFADAAKTFIDSLDQRRGLIDEMEKLIGVRELGEHPDGVRGGTLALLGITDKLEPTCKARWSAFVISTLLDYLNKQGTDAEIMARVTAAYTHLAVPPGFLKHQNQGFEDFIVETLQTKWRELHTGDAPPGNPGGDLRTYLKDKLAERYSPEYTAEIKQFAYVANTGRLTIDLSADGRRSQMNLTLDTQRPMAQASKIAK